MSPSLHRIALSLAVALSCTVGGIDGAKAQRAPSKAPAKGAQASPDTDRALDGAAKALDAGNADAAMSALDGILSGGGLSNPHMARALYLRGLAHRKKGRPAQAIADLTSAIWLKDGLNEKDRAAALSARSEVTREVGIAAPASGGGDAAPASQAASSAPAPDTSSRARVAASSRPVASALSEAGFTRGFSSTPPSPAPEPEPPPPVRSSEPAPSAGPATSSWQSTTTVDAKGRQRSSEPRREVSAAPPPASPPPAPASSRPADPPTSSGGGIGSFLSGLFTGGSAVTKAPSGDAGGSSQWRPRTERAETVERPPEPKVAEHKSARVSRAEPSKDATTIATSAVSGAYRLQIATVRSRKEANAVATRVRGEYAGAIGNRQIEIDETVFGGMGTFYRVRLGPYANMSEPKVLCDQLRPKGYDCLVVTN
jgi:hypothetical protein